MSRTLEVTATALTIALLAFTGCDTESETARETERAVDSAAREAERAAESAVRQIEAAFSDVDLDGDGTIDEEDWNSWWDDEEWFSNWDLDADGYVTENEFRTGVQGRAFGEHVDASVSAQWDEDGDDRLAEEELRTGLFDWMDRDGDGSLGNDEWELDVEG